MVTVAMGAMVITGALEDMEAIAVYMGPQVK
jgi:hypothetical protein